MAEITNVTNSVIVVPCYNESKRINPEQYLDQLKKFSSTVILVDDGSPDDTYKVLHKLEMSAPDRFGAIKMIKNKGKAEAVRLGMNHALQEYRHAKYIGYLDADLAVKFSEAPDMIDCFKKNPNITTVIGVRTRNEGYDIQRSNIKYFMQRIIAKMGNMLFSPDVIDTQCGAKFFKAEALKTVIKEPFISKWLFDQELLTRLYKQRKSDEWLHSYPVKSWTEIGNSHRKTTDYLRCLKEYFKILKRYGLKK